MLDLAFVGALPPQEDREGNPAFSPAGVRFQEQMLGALMEAGACLDRAFLLRASPSYPRRKKLWFRGGNLPATLGPQTRWLPFLNLPGKSVVAGIFLFPQLLAWCLRHRQRHHAAILLYNITHPLGIFSVWAGRLARVPVVAVIADINVPGSGLVPDSAFRRAEFALQKYTLPRLSGIIALTRRMVADFAPDVPSIRVEGALAAPAEKRRARGSDGHFVLMYAGGLNELKGVPLLLAAFAQLQGEHYRLWISGAGPLKDRVQSAAATDRRINFLGFLSDDELQQRYVDADLLVNPHSTDQASARYVFPSKLLEFIATGTPVLSTVSTPELEAEYAHVLYLLREPSAAAMAAAIERIAQTAPADRQAKGTAARGWVLAHKSWASQGRRMHDFIADCAATGAASAAEAGTRQSAKPRVAP